MYAAASRCEGLPGRPADLPAFVRARGRIDLACEARGGRTIAARRHEAGALRVRFPREEAAGLCAVIVNVAGGIAGGDRHEVAVAAGSGARLVVSTAAAEKVYRALGEPARIDVRLEAGAAARLDWLPQETILFDRARLARQVTIDLDPQASLTFCEATVLGRTAMGETLTEALFHDRWLVRRAGRLIYADATRLDGAVAARLARSACANGACAFATVLHVAPDAEARLDAAREALAAAAAPGCEAAASAWNGLIAVRFLGRDGLALRRALTGFLEGFRGAKLPRSWAT